MKVLKRGLDLERFFASVRQADRRVLLLDYDGTLAPFQAERDKAFPYDGVPQLLNRLIEAGETRVILISGRQISDLLPLLGLKRLPQIWGSHGWERLKPDGTYQTTRPSRQARQALSEAYAWAQAQGWQARAELKPGSLALHLRGLALQETQEIRRQARQGWSALAAKMDLTLAEFDGGLELRAPGHDKGSAVRTVLAELDPDAALAYLGDDLTDEDAFQAIKRRGLAVLVRGELRPTAADLWLKPPDELLEFLSRWPAAAGGER